MDNPSVDAASLRAGLSRVRQRRRYLWAVIVIYLPMMWLTQRVTGSFEKSLPMFGAWCVLLVVAVSLVAAAKCPRCGNLFHVNGMTMLVLRHCLHCQLHVTEDRRHDLAEDGDSPTQR